MKHLIKKIAIYLSFAAIISNYGQVIENKNYIDFVNPFIGTGGHGHTYPGASLPFGMIQLSPDTRLDGWDGCSGYHFSDSVIYGFSHTHLSGTGVLDYGDILLMPTIGKINFDNGINSGHKNGYSSKFSHKNEIAKPGYYSVLLEDYGIQVELSVTERAGIHKYIFPKSDSANIILDLEHRDKVIDSYLKICNNNEIEGYRISKEWAEEQHIYFVIQFSKPFETFLIENEPTTSIEKSGNKIKCSFNFKTDNSEEIIIKIGISAVSIEGARKNLLTEIPDWNFDRIVSKAKEKWNNELSKIEIETTTEDEKIIFYTALYHAFLCPNLFNDVDGNYRGRDLKIHNTKDFENYTVFSLWDTYRATHPLFTIIQKKRTVDFIKTFLSQFEFGGRLPVWELAGNETFCMIGYHSIPVIVDAYVKGIINYDVEKIYKAMKHSAEQNDFGLKYFKQLGYIPASEEAESVSKTLEYSYDDWCIALMAKLLGKEDDYKYFIQRAQSYKNLFDNETGFMRAKMDARWFEPFDPREVNFNYTEANAWQYSFYIPQDINGLINLLGGKEKFNEKLNELFSTSSETTGREQADIAGLIGQYAHGNEPSHHMAYLYNFIGQPWKTQELVRKICNEMYSIQPDGLIGNEDCGQMSAWYIFSALGFYPVTPGCDYYAIGTPLVKEAIIKLEDGKKFKIKTENLNSENIFIQSVILNGKKWDKSYLFHKDIIAGGEIIFVMGDKPNYNWATQKDNSPMTRIDDFLISPVPIVISKSKTFIETMKFELKTVSNNSKIFFTTDGSEPNFNSRIYTEPILIDKTTTIKAFAFDEGLIPSKIISQTLLKIPEERKITLLTKYANQYSAGGDNALIDYIYGQGDFRTGSWQGYQGVDLIAIVDLGKTENVKNIKIGFLQDINSWIFFPTEVEFYISNNNEDFELIGRAENQITHNQWGVHIQNFETSLIDREVRYIKIVGKNLGICPEWHKGRGNPSWIFADEITIE